ncbi:MAG: pantoate--beta-alanine ligase [Candidatus Saganbacteria bacterium]|nr:pantoate--beta-alanine ligase [Candidatus Saganbacteria bacterium]
MIVIKSLKKMQEIAKRVKDNGKRIGLVPTMGFLHEGHLSLVRASKRECDITVVSIFVNPTQFGPKEDYRKYPRDISRDMRSLKGLKVDIVFCPGAEEMYGKDFSTFVEVKGLGEVLCGAGRPGHFRGVTTVVAKLFEIVKPDSAYFGRKDYQQQLIIKKMVSDLNMGVKIKSLPTVREADGLAMSSRNAYLSVEERKEATVLYASLKLAGKLVRSGEADAKKIISAMRVLISKKPGVKIDYLGAYDSLTLKELARIKGKTLFALAAFIGPTRLIDNMVV